MRCSNHEAVAAYAGLRAWTQSENGRPIVTEYDGDHGTRDGIELWRSEATARRELKQRWAGTGETVPEPMLVEGKVLLDLLANVDGALVCGHEIPVEGEAVEFAEQLGGLLQRRREAPLRPTTAAPVSKEAAQAAQRILAQLKR